MIPDVAELRDTLAAVAFLFGVEGELYEDLNDPSPDTLERLQKLIALRRGDQASCTELADQ